MDLLEKIQEQAFKHVQAKQGAQVQGWTPKEFLVNFKEALAAAPLRELLILEVGTWKGLSANIMANICRQSNRKARIVCIDTWLGSPEHQQDLERVNGYPTLYNTFLTNTKSLKNTDMILPFPISSTQAADFFRMKNIRADIIYIDAAHEYEAVKLDIHMYWPLLRDGGAMLFDDYKWPGVQKAIDEFLQLHPGVKHAIRSNQVIVHKD